MRGYTYSYTRSRDRYRSREQFWYVYCLSDDGKWVFMAARRTKEEAEEVRKRLEEKLSKVCKVVLGSF